jgi:Prenyltransferase and squalene oxidase repeat
MNIPPITWRLLLIWLGLSVLAARADHPVRPDEAKLRAAIAKSLNFLDNEADTWMDERNCNACHHMPELLWSHREAKRRGLPIDQKKFDELVAWSYAPGKNTKAGLEMTAFLKLALPDKPAPELTKLILDEQQPDGSWKPAGQFAVRQRRDTREATENSTRLFLLALAAQDADQQAAEEARKKAAAWIEANEPAKSVETLVFRILYAERFGSPEKADALRAGILKLQHLDGGWAWAIGDEQSDSLATGEVLYALEQSPDTSCAGAVTLAQNWLLDRQRADGGWSIDFARISRFDRSGPDKIKSFKDATGIYTFWGSAWATIGLLQGLPIAEP